MLPGLHGNHDIRASERGELLGVFLQTFRSEWTHEAKLKQPVLLDISGLYDVGTYGATFSDNGDSRNAPPLRAHI